MPEPITTPSTTGSTAAASTPASSPAQFGLTPSSWAPAGKPQANQDFSRFDRMEKPASQTPSSNDDTELVDPELETEGEEKILDIKDIDEKLVPKEEPVKKELQKEVVQHEEIPAEQQQQLPAQRDYTQFDEEGQKVLKKARNEVFAYAEKLNKQVKELATEKTKLAESLTKAKEGGIPDSYLDHPEAYQLLPDYQRAVSDYQTDAFEENHWATQLERIEQGQPWQRLLGYQDGKPVYETVKQRVNADNEVVLDARAKVDVMRALSACSTARQTSGTRIQQVVGGFKQLQQTAQTRIQEFEHNSFPGMKDMKPELKADVQKIISNLPNEIQRTPLASFIAKGSLLVGALQHRVKALETELSQAKGIASDKRAAGPTQKSFTSSGGSQEKMLDAAEFGDV